MIKPSFIFKRISVSIFLTGLLFSSSACTYLGSKLLVYQLSFRPAEFGVRIERSVVIKTSDGVLLVSDIYHPEEAGPTPTILVRIPYTKTFTNTLFATMVGRMWAERGYTVMIQGTRGRYESTGHYDPLRHERQDGIETLHWIAGQPWFDGRLGMWGGSYFGYTQWVLSDQANPGPSALMIQIASTDFHEIFTPAGLSRSRVPFTGL